jgi:O-antigen/teichoic acid export membrane protein
MVNNNSSYKSMVRSTAVFGGAQVIQMLIIILRAKFIAVFLGSEGMGLNAIFQSTIAVISSFSCFGIFQSAVRDISQAYESGDRKKLSNTVAVFERLVWFLGILGLIVCLFGSYWLSKLAFNNKDFTGYFALLSIAVFFMALSNGKMVFLQGTRSLNYLAKASMLAAGLSLAISIPFFYYLGPIGIVISIISSSLLLYFCQLYYSRKVKLEKIETIKFKQIINEGTPMVKLGVVLMVGMVMITIFTYITNIYIGRYGRIEDVGLFQGVSSITTQSISVVMAVLASDFFPRLSAIYQDKDKVEVMVNQQLEMVSLIIVPIIVVLIVFSDLIVQILLSNEFLVVVPMLRWMALSLLARGIWLTMSYIILANGDRKAYFIYDALIGNGLLFLINITAYSYWGLQGLGISFLIGSIVVSSLLFMVVRVKYKFSFNFEFVKILMILMLLVLTSYLITILFDGWIKYSLSTLVMIYIFIYSFKILNKRIGILQMLKARF